MMTAKGVLIRCVVPTCIVLVPVYYLCGKFSEPGACLNLVRLLVVLTLATTYNLYHDKKLFKVFSGVSVVLVGLLGCYQLDMVSGKVFVAICAGMLTGVCVLTAMLGVFIGQCWSLRFQSVLLAVSLGGPLIMLIAFGCTGRYSLFQYGVLASVCASTLNIFFNKTDMSVGIPGTQRKARHD